MKLIKAKVNKHNRSLNDSRAGSGSGTSRIGLYSYINYWIPKMQKHLFYQSFRSNQWEQKDQREDVVKLLRKGETRQLSRAWNEDDFAFVDPL